MGISEKKLQERLSQQATASFEEVIKELHLGQHCGLCKESLENMGRSCKNSLKFSKKDGTLPSSSQ